VALAFERAAGVKFNHIPFAGGGPSVTAILGGHVNAVSVSPPEGISQVQAKKLKIIALFAKQRLAMFPDAPTVKEQGIDFAMGCGGDWRPPRELLRKSSGYSTMLSKRGWRTRFSSRMPKTCP